MSKAAYPQVGRDLPPGRHTTQPDPRRGSGRVWRALGLVLLMATGALPGSQPDTALAAGRRPDGPLVPAAGFYVGAYTKSREGYSEHKQREAVEDLEAHLGRRLHIDHHFYDWEKEFPHPNGDEHWDIAHGRIPMISWNGAGVKSSDIAAGRFDGMIVNRADGVKALEKPVFIRWFWEMDGNKKSEWAQSPEHYKAAWRHIVTRFRERGATNAVWVWCPNASAFEDGEAFAWYPGADYVDWICGDGYNFSPNRGDPWESFEKIFKEFYEEGAKLDKPMMVGEFGVLEGEPGAKGQWFRDAHDTLAEKYPAIAALVYFNADSTTAGIYYDWRVDTSESSYEGFRYLFTGPAPVPRSSPTTSPSVTQPPPPPPPPPPTTSRPAPRENPRPVTTRPAPRPVAPEPDPEPVATPEPPARQPTTRLTWVLSLLRHLDSIAVPTGR